MLRYLLGDSTFGSDDFHDAIRDKFPNACVAGEVYLDGEPWLLVRTLREALVELDELDRSRQKQKEPRTKIEKFTEALRDLRKREEKQLSIISDYFSSVASRLLNQPVKGHVRFNADKIRPSLEYAGDMSSAALVTLRLLIFDLACLIGSQHTLTNHQDSSASGSDLVR